MSERLTLANLPASFQFILNTVFRTLRAHGDDRLDELERSLAVDAFLAIGPRDALEAMWAAQAVVMSHAAMAAWARMGQVPDDPDLTRRHQREAVMLTKSGAQMVRLIQQRRRQNARDAAPERENKPDPAPDSASPPIPVDQPGAEPARRTEEAKRRMHRKPVGRGEAAAPAVAASIRTPASLQAQSAVRAAGAGLPVAPGRASATPRLSRAALLSSVTHMYLPPIAS